MTVKLSEEIRAALAGPVIGAMDRIRIYTGTQPGTPDSVITDTLLGTVTIAFTTDGVGGGALTAAPYTALAVADGEAGWGRVYPAGAEDLYFFDVSVGEADTDCIVDDATLVAGDTISVASMDITIGGT